MPSSGVINSLCHSLEASKTQFCGRVCGGDYQYSIYQEPLPYANHPRTITLDEILRQGSGGIPSRRQRITLSLILASSFLQLLESPWLQSSWQKSDIIFLEDPARSGIFMFDRPHLKHCLERAGEPAAPTELERRAQLSSALDMLGIVLVELCFGQLLEEQPCRLKYSNTGNNNTNRAFDYLAAREWQASIEEEVGYDYSVAVAWCLGGIRSTPPGQWREAMLGTVVNPLYACYSHLQ